jgi:hypothetical protein
VSLGELSFAIFHELKQDREGACMNKYVRIMHPAEAEVIKRKGEIPTNYRDWGEYKAGTVVFLFQADHVSWKYICAYAEDIVDVCGTAVILTFEKNLCCTADKSGWEGGGAVVHDGPIKLDTVLNRQSRLYVRPCVETGR